MTTHEGAKWRQGDSADDAPRQQPMQAGLKPAQRKQPTADQKKVRRQMAKSAFVSIAHVSQCPECQGQSAGHDDSHWHMHGMSTHYLDKVGNDYVARHRESGQIAKRWTDRYDAIKGAWSASGDDWPDARPQGGYPEEKSRTAKVARTTGASPACPECGTEGKPENSMGASTHGHVSTPDHCKVWTWGDDGKTVAKDVHTKGERDAMADAFDARLRGLNPFKKGAMDIDNAGDRTCAACGHHGAPVMGDTSPACAACGSYSLNASPLTPGPNSREVRGEPARYKTRGDYERTSALESREATQFSRNLARQDGQLLIQPGESIRLPNGSTTKIRNIRRHETSGDHYYVDTDMGTTVSPWSTSFEVVPSEGQQQPLPGFADPRANSNKLPGSPSPHAGPSQQAASDKCPVCGGSTMTSKGTKAQCTRCGYTQSNQGGPSFSDSPQMINPRASLSAVARRAAEVADQMKETL